MDTLGTQESGRYKEVAVVDRLYQQSTCGLFIRWERWLLVEFRL